MNPTQDVLEKRVAALEGGIAALAVASGMSAITYAIQTITEAGDNFIPASQLYGGTYNLFAHTLPQMAIEVRFADTRKPETFAALIDARTKAIFCESIGNHSLAIAKQLQKHPKVAWANYAGLPDHADHALVKKYMSGKASGILSFGLKHTYADPRASGARVLDAFKLFTRLVNIGDAKSLATHPASTTHRPLNPADLAKAGVSEDMVRLSIGIEHIDDLRADLDQALAAVSAGEALEIQTATLS